MGIDAQQAAKKNYCLSFVIPQETIATVETKENEANSIDGNSSTIRRLCHVHQNSKFFLLERYYRTNSFQWLYIAETGGIEKFYLFEFVFCVE